jgi:homoserine kinase
MSSAVRVGVPATTANLGPGFDCLGLSIDLWNEAEFSLSGRGLLVEISGEGQDSLPQTAENLVIRAFHNFYQYANLPIPADLHVSIHNRVPSGSGLGSSASAVLLGLLGARFLSGRQASPMELLGLAAGMEGHSDNAAAALLGGLVVSLKTENAWLARRFDVPALHAALVLPDINLPTLVARQALPLSVPRSDAVYNVSRAVLVAEALRCGDLDLLGQVMEDRLHQPYRLPLIRGAAEAMAAAKSAGAQAVAISGAGPSLIAFCAGASRPAGEAMAAAFSQAGVASRTFELVTTSRGAWTRAE